MATLLNTQNPLAALCILWCPGGLPTKTSICHGSYNLFIGYPTQRDVYKLINILHLVLVGVKTETHF